MTTQRCSKTKHMLALGLILAVSGCSTMESDWEKAQQEDNISSYQEFMSKHPDSEYKSIAAERFESSLWVEIYPRNEIKLYNKYIAMYPNSPHVKEAKVLVDALIKDASNLSENWKKHMRSDEMTELLSFCFDSSLTREQVRYLMGKPHKDYSGTRWVYNATGGDSCEIHFNRTGNVIAGELKSSSGAYQSKGRVPGGTSQSWGWSPPK